jgi:hypothetical protein
MEPAPVRGHTAQPFVVHVLEAALEPGTETLARVEEIVRVLGGEGDDPAVLQEIGLDEAGTSKAEPSVLVAVTVSTSSSMTGGSAGDLSAPAAEIDHIKTGKATRHVTASQRYGLAASCRRARGGSRSLRLLDQDQLPGPRVAQVVLMPGMLDDLVAAGQELAARQPPLRGRRVVGRRALPALRRRSGLSGMLIQQMIMLLIRVSRLSFVNQGPPAQGQSSPTDRSTGCHGELAGGFVKRWRNPSWKAKPR